MQLPPIEIGRLISRSMWIERGHYKISLAFKQTQQTPSIVLLTAGWGEPASVSAQQSGLGWEAGQTDPTPTCEHAKHKESKLHRERAYTQQEFSCCNM